VPGQAAGAGGQAAVPVSTQGQPADVGEAFVSNPPHRGRDGRAHGGVWAGGLTGVRRVRDTSVDHSRARAAQACLCSQMAVQLISLVNCPTTLTRNPRACRKTIHNIPESQGCLVLLCLGWSTTLCGDGRRWKVWYLFETEPIKTLRKRKNVVLRNLNVLFQGVKETGTEIQTFRFKVSRRQVTPSDCW